MRKLFSLVLALVLTFGGVSFAGQQIDEGQTRGQTDSVTKFFVARNARVAGVSADRVVIWDTTSNDGITVTTTTTSYDNLTAGVTIDAIPGVTSDTTAAANLTGRNWGRVQVYGRHASVSFDNSSNSCAAGARIASHNLAGQATAMAFRPANDKASWDYLVTGVSGEILGVALEACAAANQTLDVFIQKG